MFRIGVTQQFWCDFDLKHLISENKRERPLTENIFFELYLRDYNDDLIDVPILVENSADASGAKPNQQDNKSSWTLTRRFFLFDTISGIRQNEYPDG